MTKNECCGICPLQLRSLDWGVNFCCIFDFSLNWRSFMEFSWDTFLFYLKQGTQNAVSLTLTALHSKDMAKMKLNFGFLFIEMVDHHFRGKFWNKVLMTSFHKKLLKRMLFDNSSFISSPAKIDVKHWLFL